MASRTTHPWLPPIAVLVAAICGSALILDGVGRSSATYDEVAYMRIAARWWRTGDQAEITRMGSPLLFWKVQQAPTLWLLDRLGYGSRIDDTEAHQAELLPWLRAGALPGWLAGLALTALWARRMSGRWAMIGAAWLYALSPNLLAHGGLMTMEAPIVATTTLTLWLAWEFLRGRRWIFGIASAVACGAAFSCKFTAIVLPPLLALAWMADDSQRGRFGSGALRRVVVGMVGFVLVMVISDLVVTGFARITPSARVGPHPSLAGRFGPRLDPIVTWLVETPMPQDWVGFANQMRHQQSGGSSYLFGERRMRGWWYYYAIALAVKVPLGIFVLALARWALRKRVVGADPGWFVPLILLGFFIITALGSSRNYGVRYLLPMAPAVLVWLSGLTTAGRLGIGFLALAVGGQAVAVASIHPHELTYFNELAGGPLGGRHVLSDSNLDWGQGARSLAHLQAKRPEFRDITVFYFGDTDPAHYGVVGRRYVVRAVGTDGLPPKLDAETPYIAVSASLQYGPWGPEGYFLSLDRVRPIALTDDTTIAIYSWKPAASSTPTINGEPF